MWQKSAEEKPSVFFPSFSHSFLDSTSKSNIDSSSVFVTFPPLLKENYFLSDLAVQYDCLNFLLIFNYCRRIFPLVAGSLFPRFLGLTGEVAGVF
ncbi:hypothetical protein V6N13_046452 [Hibiscus sabdariffa]|uniref:Uncharacterized protein n=1 Tax=Hibiscus sabdariffa TaxID=183260 RepID=A0ABR2NZ12_9ROSI